MKKRFLFTALFLVIFLSISFFLPSPSSAMIPFGGDITFMYEGCFEGFWLIIGPPTPMDLIFPWGAMSFDYGPPSHPGQWLLGMASGFLTCTIMCGPEPCVIGGGLMILYHGSSN